MRPPANPSAISTWTSKSGRSSFALFHGIQKTDCSCLCRTCFDSPALLFSASKDLLESHAPMSLAPEQQMSTLPLSGRIGAWELMA